MHSDRPWPSRRVFLATALSGLSVVHLALPDSATAEPTHRVAPVWDISEWINGDPGTVEAQRGKVVVIDFFQLWCPGCNKFSGPLMDHWQVKFASEIEAEKLLLIKIHTVFEGHSHQTVKRLKSYLKEKNITIPVGVDRHVAGRRVPETMRRYRTRGTPEMAVIDRDGLIRFQKFGYFEDEPVEALIASLIEPERA